MDKEEQETEVSSFADRAIAAQIGLRLINLLRRKDSTQITFEKVDKNKGVYGQQPKWCWVVQLSSGPEVERNGKRSRDWLEAVYTCEGPDVLLNESFRVLIEAIEGRDHVRSLQAKKEQEENSRPHSLGVISNEQFPPILG